jgi:competence protein ComEC
MLLPLWSAALALGIALAVSLPVPVAFGVAGVALLAGVGLALSRRIVLGGAALAVGLGVLLARQAQHSGSLAPVLEEAVRSGREVEVTARWVRTLRFPAPAAQLGEQALLDLVTAGGQGVRARLLLTLAAHPKEVLPGDLVSLRTRLAEPVGLVNFGLSAPARHPSGADLLAAVVRESPIVVLQPGWRFGGRRLAHLAHMKMAAAIEGAVAGPAAGLLRALVLGERFAVAPESEAGFKAAGALHVLSVSGLHLTALAAFLFLIIRRLILFFPGLALRVRPEVVAGLCCLPVIGFYTLVTGEAVATARAALMGGLGFGAVIMRRPPSAANAIGAAAIALLLTSPLLLLDVSFQLSFGGVLALAMAARGWKVKGDGAAGIGRRIGRWLLAGSLASLAAFVVTAPLCAHHFAEIAPAAPLGNLLLVPPMELGALPLGLAGAVLGAFHPAAGLPLLWAAERLSSLALWLADGFGRFAPVLPVMSPNAFETLLLLLGALVLPVAAGRPPRPRLLLGVGLALVCGAGAMSTRLLLRQMDPDLRVTFLDVGQGDAALVEGPGGFVMLIDAGGAINGSFDPGARVIGPILRRRGIDRIDLLVLSHPHPDHMNGLHHLLDRFEVRALWTAGDGGGNPEYDRLIARARARGVDLPEPRSHARGPLTIEARGPLLDGAVRTPPGVSVNDASLVVRLGFAGRWFLFTGDIEEQGEAELVGAATPGSPLNSDVLKVPHHGSRTSSSDDLLDAVAPQVAIASLGRRNRFGFPRAEVLARYASRGIELLRTDLHGAVMVQVTARGDMQATCARSCR